jgi:Protein of unknown function (DUF1579)
MNIPRIAALLTAIVGLAGPVCAQDSGKAAAASRMDGAALAQLLANAMTPGEGQKKLEPMIGTFEVKIRTWIDPSKPPVESLAICINTWVLGQRYMRSTLSGFVAGEPFDGIGYVAYDNVAKVYQTAWMDSGSTSMVSYRGGFDASGRSATLKATVSDPITAKPVPIELRMSMADSGDHMSEIWGQGLGTQLFKMMELRYTRTKQ